MSDIMAINVVRFHTLDSLLSQVHLKIDKLFLALIILTVLVCYFLQIKGNLLEAH